MAETPITGHCLCGAVSFSAPSRPKWTALCHCESCRRACSAPIVAWMGFAAGDVDWTGTRTFYHSSDIAIRGFCATCGTQMSFESANWPGEVHLYAISGHAPETYAPDLHCHYGERLDWLEIADDLPKYHARAGEKDAAP